MPSYSGSGGSSRSAKRPTGSSGGSLPMPKPVGAGSSMPIGNPDGTKQRQAKKNVDGCNAAISITKQSSYC